MRPLVLHVDFEHVPVQEFFDRELLKMKKKVKKKLNWFFSPVKRPAIISFSITGSKKCPAEIMAFKGRPGSTKHSGLVWPIYCKRSLRLSKSSAASSKLGKTLACRCLKIKFFSVKCHVAYN